MKLLICCVVSVLLGALALYIVPQFPAIGVALVGVAVILGLQAALLALVSKFSPPVSDTTTADTPPEYPSDLSYLLAKYREFRVFLIRVAGFAGLVYGLVTLNTYYIVLGCALMVLFWTFDRMGKRARDPADAAQSQSSPVR